MKAIDYLLPCVLLLAVAFGCNSASDHPQDGDGGLSDAVVTSDGTDDLVAPFPHTFCETDGPDPRFVELGKSCSAGSNLDLCLMTHGKSCANGMCLWAAEDPVGGKAYCTVACDASDTSSCPPSYSCMQEGCDGKYVCVRTAAPPKPTAPYKMTSHDGPAVEDWEKVSDWYDAGHTSDGTAFWVTKHGARLYRREPDGTWSFVGQFEEYLGHPVYDVANPTLTILSDIAYLFTYDWIVRAGEGQPVRKEPPFAVAGLFRDKSQRVYAFESSCYDIVDMTCHNQFDRLFELDDKLETKEVQLQSNPLKAESKKIWIEALLDHGFIAAYKTEEGDLRLFTGTDGTDTRAIPHPEGWSWNDPSSFVTGSNPDNIWLLWDKKILHFDGATWTTEKLPGQDYVHLHYLADDSVVAFSFDHTKHAISHFDGTCWRDLPFNVFEIELPQYNRLFVTLGKDRLGWIDVVSYSNPSYQLVEIDLGQ